MRKPYASAKTPINAAALNRVNTEVSSYQVRMRARTQVCHSADLTKILIHSCFTEETNKIPGARFLKALVKIQRMLVLL